MALTNKRAQELASLLPDGMQCTDARERLLCLVQILHTLTDADHALSNADIRAILHARFGPGCTPAENTIGADLRAIRDAGCLGLDVHITPAGTWSESATLDAGKVRLLLNAVQASRFLTTEQGYDLQESLFDLVSRHQEEELDGQVYVEHHPRPFSQKVLGTCSTVAHAIREGRKLEFNYAYNDFSGKPHFLEGDDGSTLRTETPIGLIFSEGNYYLETYADTPWRHGTNLQHCRVDRMYNTRVSQIRATKNADVQSARSSLKRRKGITFDMVGGQERVAFLRVRADYTNVAFDKFGFGLKFDKFEGRQGDVNTTAVCCVRVAESFTFYRWLSSAGCGIVLERPKSEPWVTMGPWAKTVDGADYQRLRADYNALRKGYLAYLDRARAPYE